MDVKPIVLFPILHAIHKIFKNPTMQRLFNLIFILYEKKGFYTGGVCARR